MDEPMRIKDPEAYKRKLKEMKRRSAGGDRVGKPPQQEKPVKMASFDRAFRTGWAIAKNDNILSPEEALKVCHAGGCVWIKDYADENYGDEDYPHFDYPVEDPEDLMTILEDAEHGGMPITILADPEPLEAPFHSTRERIDLGGSRDE